VMSIIGGALFTLVLGLMAAKSMAVAMLVPLACYVCVAGYAFWGSKIPPRIPAHS